MQLTPLNPAQTGKRIAFLQSYLADVSSRINANDHVGQGDLRRKAKELHFHTKIRAEREANNGFSPTAHEVKCKELFNNIVRGSLYKSRYV